MIASVEGRAAWIGDGARRARTRRPPVAIAVRRFSGPLADEVFVHCRPAAGLADVAREAAATYEALFDALASEGVGPEAIVSETVFLRQIREHFMLVRSARSRVLGTAGVHATFIGQRPLASVARLEVSAVAIVPRGRAFSSMDGTRAKVVRLGDETTLYAGSIHGSGRDAYDEGLEMFRVAEGLLADAGMSFADVVRTWIYVRDIDRHYAALNRARREFFRRCGIERRPASTCVQGIPFPGVRDFSMTIQAATSPRGRHIAPMRTPLLNEAWTYGADFSRGLRIVGANEVTLHVSGTASIDDAGRTVHAGRLEAQVDRMLENIASLLAGQGATFDDLASATAYLRNPDDAPVLRSMFRERGFDGFPCAIVEAPLCRPDLLCETEAVAVLPVVTGDR